MHPKEGWQADGRPPIPGVSRRGFLRQGADAGIALGSGGLGALLARVRLGVAKPEGCL